MSEKNPYAAPQSRLGPEATPEQLAAARAERQELLAPEGLTAGMGTLMMLGGGVAGLLALPFLYLIWTWIFERPAHDRLVKEALRALVLVVGLGVMAAVGLLGGLGVRQLKPTSRVAATMFAALLLVFIPIGPLLSLWFAYLLFSEKGRRVLSEEGLRIRALTPDMRYETTTRAWLGFAAVFFLLLACVGLVGA